MGEMVTLLLDMEEIRGWELELVDLDFWKKGRVDTNTMVSCEKGKEAWAR